MNKWYTKRQPGNEEQSQWAEELGLDSRHADDAKDIARILKLARHEVQEPAIRHPHEAKFDDPDQAAEELEREHQIAA